VKLIDRGRQGGNQLTELGSATIRVSSWSMPILKTFWAERFGMVVDRFGIP
jgi:uncharacterized glyoxalase superfamily protein PhnB